MEQNIISVIVIASIIEVSPFGNEFMQLQSQLCSYISLCTRSNTTVFDGRFSWQVPCCQECSCNQTCFANGNCCPDYLQEDVEKSLAKTFLESTTQGSKVANMAAKNSLLGCIRIAHGVLDINDGYIMDDSCPRNYINATIKQLCERKTNLTRSIFDYVPVSNSMHTKVFKNRYCKICSVDDDLTYQFWNIRLICSGQPVFRFLDYRNPEDLVKQLQTTQMRMCSILFIPNLETSVLEACTKEEVIDTCADEYIGTDTETACFNYTWPIMVKRLAFKNYKNYACALCNGETFQPICTSFDFQKGSFFTATLNIDPPEIGTSNGRIPGNKSYESNGFAPQHEHNSTSIYLQNKDYSNANITCSEWSVYDERKIECRRLHCPELFFMKNGKCEPIFHVMENVIYNVLLELCLPFNFNSTPSHVSQTVFLALDDLLAGRLGRDNFDLSLWTNSKLLNDVRPDRFYVALVSVNSKFAGGDYLAFLKCVHHLLNVERYIPVPDHLKTRIVKIGLKFASFIGLSINGKYRKLRYLKRRNPFQVISLNLITQSAVRKFDNVTLSNMIIRKESLCYRVILYDEEYTLFPRQTEYFEVVATGTVMFNSHQQLRITGKYTRYKYMMCINDVLSGTDERWSYIIEATDSPDILCYPPTKWMNRINTKSSVEITFSNNETDKTRPTENVSTFGFVALGSVFGLVIFVIVVTGGLHVIRKNRSSNTRIDGNVTETNKDIQHIPMNVIRGKQLKH